MEIQHLALRDVGPFRGLHVFDFRGEEGKTGFAVFSKNGRGKTTMFNAMQWCLFGEVFERSRIIDGRRVAGQKRKIVGDVPEPLMNEIAYDEDPDPEMSVTIIATSKRGDIQISRTAKARYRGLPRTDDDLKIELVVKFGDETESDVTGQELIERFFPNEIKRFFFIDGEILDEYVNLVKTGQVGGVKDDIEAVLRIPALTRGEDDLQEIRDTAQRAYSRSSKRAKSAGKKVGRGNAKKRGVEKMRRELDSKVRIKDQSKKRLGEIEERLSGYEEAADHIRSLRDLRSRKEGLLVSLGRSSEAKVKTATNAWKVLIWAKAEAAHREAEGEMVKIQNSKFAIDTLKLALERDKEELAAWTGLCTHCEQPIPDTETHREKLKGKIKREKEEIRALQGESPVEMSVLSVALGDLSKLSPPHGTAEVMGDADESWQEDRSTLKGVIEKLEKEESRGFEGGIDEDEVWGLFEEKGKLQSSIRGLEAKIDEMRLKVRAEELEVKKLLGAAGDDVDHSEARIVETMDRILETIKQTIAQYWEIARSEVEERASEAFRNVTNAPGALTGVLIDSNFRARIRESSGKAIKAPSTGQEITMTLCVLDALRQTSRVEAPIFFDTPGRAQDEDHKKAQLEYFWKLRDHQFIIFPHSGEYRVDETISEFSGQIGGAWELLWPVDYAECPECGSSDPLPERGRKRCVSCDHSWDITSRSTIVKKLEIPS